MDYSRAKLTELEKYAETGDWSWTAGANLAGALMIVTSSLGFFDSILYLSPFTAVLNLYIICFGVIAILLENKEYFLTKKYRDIIKTEARFLDKPYGRAGFYFFVGILLVAKGGLLGFLVGLYTSFIGAVIFYGSKAAYDTLDRLKTDQYTEAQVKEKFYEFDRDKSGALDAAELAALCKALGSTLSRRELESALFLLDKNEDGQISFEEFFAWYKGKDV